MNITRSTRPARLRAVIMAAALAASTVVAVTVSQIAPAKATTRHAADDAPRPTIVLEHGAWADASGWDPVIRLLQADGYTVYAPPDPLAGLASDSATLADFLGSITGPDHPGRAFLRRDGHHQRRHRQPERQGPGLHRRVHPGPGRHHLRARRRPARLLPGLGQRLHGRALPGRPDRRRRRLPQDRSRCALPGVRPVLRQRPARQAGRDAGRHPAPHRLQRRAPPPRACPPG